jgi:hypothetical protein
MNMTCDVTPLIALFLLLYATKVNRWCKHHTAILVGISAYGKNILQLL